MAAASEKLLKLMTKRAPCQLPLCRLTDMTARYGREPGQLTRLGDLPTRTFCVGDKVRYVPRGRSKYLYEPKKDKIYDVVTRESESGQVGISGHGFNDDINRYDLELVEPVAKLPYYAETGLVRRRKDGKCVVTFLYSRLSKETADRLAQMVCDKLNELEGEKA